MATSEGGQKLVQRERAKVDTPMPDVERRTLAYNDSIMMCHFRLQAGAKIPLHNHEAVQNGYVISGTARFFREDGSHFEATAGVSYVFDAWERHGGEAIEDTELIECFAPMRPEYA